MPSQFPWDLIKAESLRAICRDLGGGSKLSRKRGDMVKFLVTVEDYGLDAALRKHIIMGEPTPSAKRRLPVYCSAVKSEYTEDDQDAESSLRRSKRPRVAVDAPDKWVEGSSRRNETSSSKPHSASHMQLSRSPRNKRGRQAGVNNAQLPSESEQLAINGLQGRDPRSVSASSATKEAELEAAETLGSLRALPVIQSRSSISSDELAGPSSETPAPANEEKRSAEDGVAFASTTGVAEFKKADKPQERQKSQSDELKFENDTRSVSGEYNKIEKAS